MAQRHVFDVLILTISWSALGLTNQTFLDSYLVINLKSESRQAQILVNGAFHFLWLHYFSRMLRWEDKLKYPFQTPTFLENVSVKVSNQHCVDWPL